MPAWMSLRLESNRHRARPPRHREHQEGQPVGHHREATQRRRIQLLERDPVADHVLDVVGHHRQRIAEQVHPVAGMPQGGEGLMRRAGIALCA